jgi:hypothetical protein
MFQSVLGFEKVINFKYTKYLRIYGMWIIQSWEEPEEV